MEQLLASKFNSNLEKILKSYLERQLKIIVHDFDHYNDEDDEYMDGGSPLCQHCGSCQCFPPEYYGNFNTYNNKFLCDDCFQNERSIIPKQQVMSLAPIEKCVWCNKDVHVYQNSKENGCIDCGDT